MLALISLSSKASSLTKLARTITDKLAWNIYMKRKIGTKKKNNIYIYIQEHNMHAGGVCKSDVCVMVTSEQTLTILLLVH